jgi:hypothetical protein
MRGHHLSRQAKDWTISHIEQITIIYIVAVLIGGSIYVAKVRDAELFVVESLVAIFGAIWMASDYLKKKH